MKIISGIYKITNPIDQIYIGESGNIYKRWSTYRRLEDVKNQSKLYNSFLKYGWLNHKFEIVEICDNRKVRELYYINEYNSFNNGLNGTPKNRGPLFHTQETKDKIGIGNRKKKIGKYKGISKIPRTKEHSNKISKALKGYKQTEEHCLNKSIAMKGKILVAKIVLQYDLQENLIKEWNSAKEACLYYNPKDLNGVSACCLGKQKTAFGYKWKYKLK